MFHICLVDQNLHSKHELAQQIAAAGYDVACFAEVKQLYLFLLQERCDAVVIDVAQLAAEDTEAIPALRRSKRPVGIIALVAPGQLDERLKSYAWGSDVCVEKPAQASEILAVLPNLLQRISGGAAQAGREGNPAPAWRMHNDGWSLLSPEGDLFKLTAKERLFMLRVMRSPDEIVSREAMVEALCEDAHDYDQQSMETMLSRLRRKLDNAGLALPLRTVRGQGYMFLTHSQRVRER
ncbi:MAG: response regulator transcription factor [Azonexus sp.]